MTALIARLQQPSALTRMMAGQLSVPLLLALILALAAFALSTFGIGQEALPHQL